MRPLLSSIPVSPLSPANRLVAKAGRHRLVVRPRPLSPLGAVLRQSAPGTNRKSGLYGTAIALSAGILFTVGQQHPRPLTRWRPAFRFSASVAYHAAALFLSISTALSIMPRPAKEQSAEEQSAKEQLAERRFQQRQEGEIAFAEYRIKGQETRLLTAKLRAERLARESKPHRKQKA